MKLLVLLFAVALASWPQACRKSNNQQLQYCYGGFDSKDADSLNDCGQKCHDHTKNGSPKPRNYFLYTTSSCKCYKCGAGTKDNAVEYTEAAESGDGTDRLYVWSDVVVNGNSVSDNCGGNTQSTGSCSGAADGTRCTEDSQCAGGDCCENYHVCGQSGGGIDAAHNGKKWDGYGYNVVVSDWEWANTWACSSYAGYGWETQVAVSQTSCDGMPTWAYGMFALLTLNPIILLWTRREKGDAYKNLLDEE